MKTIQFRGRALALGACAIAGLCLAWSIFPPRDNPAMVHDAGHNPGHLPQVSAKTVDLAMPTPTGAVPAGNSGLLPQWESTLVSGDNVLIAGALASLDACPACLARLQEMLQDPSRSLSQRTALARALVSQGTRLGPVAVVKAIRDANLAGDLDLREGLVEALADAKGLSSAAGLADLAAGQAEGVTLQELPEDLRAAVRKAIRLNPEGEATGRLLAEHYQNQTTAEVRRDLEAIGQPWMFSSLAENATANGATEDAARFVQHLARLDDPDTLDAIGGLSERGVITAPVAADLALGWVSTHQAQFPQDRYAAWLSDPEVSNASKSVAAFALTGGADSNAALAALTKAAAHATDPGLYADLTAAIARIPSQPNTR